MPYKDKKSPKARFVEQAGNAARRGVEWHLTFEQWWSLWEPYWTKRGVGRGRMMMLRTRDEGPYALSNVRIGLHEENRREQVVARGDTHSSSKLSGECVARVRDMLAAGVLHKNIAAWFGVARQAITSINLGLNWKHTL